jgi:hypothetical protein
MSYLIIESQEKQQMADHLVGMMMNPSMFSQETLTKELDPYIKRQIDRTGPYKVERTCCKNTCDFCETFDAGVMGRGVRAKRTIWMNTQIGCYTGVLRCKSDKHKGDWRYNYAYGLDEYHIDASPTESSDACMMALLNHSEKDENVRIEYALHDMPDGRIECHIVFIANRSIMRTEELFIDYGMEYWRCAKKRGIVEYELDQMGNKHAKEEPPNKKVSKVKSAEEEDFDVGSLDIGSLEISPPSSSPYFNDKSQKRITDYMIDT